MRLRDEREKRVPSSSQLAEDPHVGQLGEREVRVELTADKGYISHTSLYDELLGVVCQENAVRLRHVGRNKGLHERLASNDRETLE